MCFFINRNYSELSLATLPDKFTIPESIRALVNQEPGNANFMDMLLQLAPAKARADPETYHLSFTTKLYLEEAAGLGETNAQYSMNDIQIEHVGNNIFRFTVNVSYFPFSIYCTSYFSNLNNIF